MRSLGKKLALFWIVVITAVLNLWVGQDLGRKMIRTLRNFTGVEPPANQTTIVPDEYKGANVEVKKNFVQQNAPNVVATKPIHKNRTITIVLQLKGELGNHLSVIANARVTQILASKLYPNLSFQFIGQHQNRENDHRWKRVQEELHRCFPNLSDFIVDGGVHDPNFDAVQKQQTAWLNARQSKLLQNSREDGLALLQRLLVYQDRGIAPKLIPSNATNGKYNYSFPFLISNSFYLSEGIQDPEMYHAMRDFFQFNESACCRRIPESTEIVYHHRNFNKVANEHRLSTLFMELSPTEASELLFANVMASSSNQSKSRIAIVSSKMNGLDNYSRAFTQTNPNVESFIVRGQTGVQDFCFLMKAQKELVGKMFSTFVEWAALLGNASLTRFYEIEHVQETMNHTLNLPSIEITRNFEQGNRRFIFEKYLIPTSSSSET